MAQRILIIAILLFSCFGFAQTLPVDKVITYQDMRLVVDSNDMPSPTLGEIRYMKQDSMLYAKFMDGTEKCLTCPIDETTLTITESQISDLAHTTNTDTQLSKTDIEAFGFVDGAHTTDTNTQLSKANIEAMGFVDGAHTTDTNTQLSDAQVGTAALSEGFVKGAHTTDTNTQLSDAQVATAATNEGFVTGAHTTNTDSQVLDQSQLNGTNLELSLSGDGEATKSIDLSSLTSNSGYEILVTDGTVASVNSALASANGVPVRATTTITNATVPIVVPTNGIFHHRDITVGATFTGEAVIYSLNTSNVYVYGHGTIDGSAATSSVYDAVKYENVTGGQIEGTIALNVEITASATETGNISVLNSTNILVKDVKASGTWRMGVYFNGGSNNSIEDGYITDTNDSGLGVVSSGGFGLLNTWVVACGTSGASNVTMDLTDATINGLISIGDYTGIGANRNGITVGHEGYPATNSKIVNSRFEGHTVGVLFQGTGTENIAVSNSSVWLNTTGFRLISPVSRITLQGNALNNTQNYNVDAGLSRVLINGNPSDTYRSVEILKSEYTTDLWNNAQFKLRKLEDITNSYVGWSMSAATTEGYGIGGFMQRLTGGTDWEYSLKGFSNKVATDFFTIDDDGAVDAPISFTSPTINGVAITDAGGGTNYLADDGTYKAAGGGTVDVVSNVATSTILGRTTAGSGNSEELTAAQVRTLLNIEDGATADQDLSSLALKSNVLELDNTTSFTPDADYEPATKKYVDDNSGSGAANGITITDSGSYFTGGDVEAALQEVGAALTTVGADALDIDAQSSYTLVAADANNDRVIDASGAITIPSGVFSEGQSIFIRYAQSASGDIEIIEGADVDVIGYLNGVKLENYQSHVILTRMTSATAPEIWEVLKGGGTYSELSCTADANEQYTTANAASDPNCNEANATTGWGGVGNQTLSSVSESDGLSNYAIQSVINEGADSGYFNSDFAATAGDTFTVKVVAKQTVGSNARIAAWTNISSGAPNEVTLTTSYVEYTYNITAAATGNISMRFYASRNASGFEFDAMRIKSISVIETTP